MDGQAEEPDVPPPEILFWGTVLLYVHAGRTYALPIHDFTNPPVFVVFAAAEYKI